MKKIRFLLWILIGLFPGALSLWAGVTNLGNDAVQIEFQKEDGLSQSGTLFPGQSMETPAETTTVRVVPRGAGARGDEKIKIKIVESNGKEGILTKYDQLYQLGLTEETEQKVVLKPGRVSNKGNLSLDVAVRKKDGSEHKLVVYLGQTLEIPRDTYEVEVLGNQRRLRGDEIIKLVVLMPDGVGYNITSLGGIARILPENQAALDEL